MKPLNPIMAVLVIASVGATPLRTLAADGDNSAPAAATEDKNPVNALSRILAANPAARTDAGKRISEFLLDADANGKSFVGPGVDTKAPGPSRANGANRQEAWAASPRSISSRGPGWPCRAGR